MSGLAHEESIWIYILTQLCQSGASPRDFLGLLRNIFFQPFQVHLLMDINMENTTSKFNACEKSEHQREEGLSILPLCICADVSLSLLQFLLCQVCAIPGRPPTKSQGYCAVVLPACGHLASKPLLFFFHG